jgi:hypothetical protein
MRFGIGTALLALAFVLPAMAEVQMPPRPPSPRTQPPRPGQPPPKPSQCSLAACVNQGVSRGDSHTGALNWCQANRNGC